MKASQRAAHGPRCLPESGQATSASQAAWRFLANEKVSLLKLVKPLREAGRIACLASGSDFVLLAHDWCKLDYGNQTKRKKDLAQLTHEYDVGYELTTSLLIDADTGNTLAPMQMHVLTADTVHSTGEQPPEREKHHLGQVLPTMEESRQWGLERKIVHVIDREADSLGKMRRWFEAGHLFLVRCKDRRVSCEGQSVLLSELKQNLAREGQFEDAGKALYEGRKAFRQVAEKTVVLDRPHSQVINGKKTRVSGKPISLRVVFVRLLNKAGKVLAEWMLLTNVAAGQADAATVGEWYYFRWRIESFFKLLKSHGQELEYWQQETGLAIAKRLLIAAMACVVVKQLEASRSEAAANFRRYLVKLSGRRMKHKVEYTAPALLAGWYVHLAMSQHLEESEMTIEELKSLENEVLAELRLV